jgi:signal transduction histidine kinase
LAAVLAVPVIVAVTLCILQIQTQVERANSYEVSQRLVNLQASLGPVIAAVQQERTLAASRLANGNAGQDSAIQQQARTVDAAEDAMKDAAAKTQNLGETATGRYQDALRLIGGLPALRQQVLVGSTDAVTAVANYSTVTKGLLDFGQALASQLGDPALSGTASALQDLLVAQDEVHLQHAIVLAGILRGRLLGTELRTLQESDVRLQDKTADFLALATPAQQSRYQQTVAGSDVNLRKQFEQLALNRAVGTADRPATGRGQGVDTSLPIPVDDWNRSSDTTDALMAKVSGSLTDELGQTAAALQDQTSTRAGAASVLLMSTLVVAAAVGFVIGRYLLRSLNVLRRTALEVAENRLPEIVAKVHAGDTEDTVLAPMPLDTTEEFGQLARAFDAVLSQAVRSTVEQAGLRSNLGNIFVNFSRRSQSLVERQLRLMEQLEQHEEDPDQLANLFKLDHLATRMRRNNENLMVLSGSELARRFSKPVPMGDVLRAAVSEVEHYQRAVVQSEANADVVGYAAGDLVRLLAELLDNATNFSPPDSQVTLGSREQRDGSVLIDVLDQGIGMSGAELEDANKRVAAEGGGEVPVSRQMGLFVVGRLASRHGFSVRLFSDEDLGGLRAFVLVPAELVKTKERRGPAELGGFAPVELTAPPATASNSTDVTHLLANPNVARSGAGVPAGLGQGGPAEPGTGGRRSAAVEAFSGAGRAHQGVPWDAAGPPTQPAEPVQGFGLEPSRPGETSRPGIEPVRPSAESSRPSMELPNIERPVIERPSIESPGIESPGIESQRPGAGSSAGAAPLPPTISPAAGLFTPSGPEPDQGAVEDGLPARVPGRGRLPADPPHPTGPQFSTNGVSGSSPDWFAANRAADEEPAGTGSVEPVLGAPAWSATDDSMWSAETRQHPVIPADPEPDQPSATPARSATEQPAEEPIPAAVNGFGGPGRANNGQQVEHAAASSPVHDGRFGWFDGIASGEVTSASAGPEDTRSGPPAERVTHPAETSRPSIERPTPPPVPAVAPSPPPAERPVAAAAPAEPLSVDVTSAGLPRRRPKAHLLPNLAQRPSPAAPESTPAHRNPERTRGFLSNYQAGVRQGRPSALQENDNPYGQENP